MRLVTALMVSALLLAGCGKADPSTISINAPELTAEYQVGGQANVRYNIDVSTGDKVNLYVAVQQSLDGAKWTNAAPPAPVTAPNEGQVQVPLKAAGALSIRTVAWLDKPTSTTAKPDVLSPESKASVFNIQQAFNEIVAARKVAMTAWDEYSVQSHACFPLEGNRGNVNTWQSCYATWVKALQADYEATAAYADAIDHLLVPSSLATVLRRYAAALRDESSAEAFIKTSFCLDKNDTTNLEACVDAVGSVGQKFWDNLSAKQDKTQAVKTEAIDGFVRLGMPDFTSEQPTT